MYYSKLLSLVALVSVFQSAQADFSELYEKERGASKEAIVLKTNEDKKIDSSFHVKGTDILGIEKALSLDPKIELTEANERNLRSIEKLLATHKDILDDLEFPKEDRDASTPACFSDYYGVFVPVVRWVVNYWAYAGSFYWRGYIYKVYYRQFF